MGWEEDVNDLVVVLAVGRVGGFDVQRIHLVKVVAKTRYKPKIFLTNSFFRLKLPILSKEPSKSD
jgi:hypothetical protein